MGLENAVLWFGVIKRLEKDAENRGQLEFVSAYAASKLHPNRSVSGEPGSPPARNLSAIVVCCELLPELLWAR